MSLGRRLLNVAKAEIQDAARKVRSSAEQWVDPSKERRSSATSNEAYEALRQQVQRDDTDGPPSEIRDFYANLELPIGSDAAEVKAAYRRLLRRYHPDKHAMNPAHAKVAGEVTQKLRTAYEGLNAYLEAR